MSTTQHANKKDVSCFDASSRVSGTEEDLREELERQKAGRRLLGLRFARLEKRYEALARVAIAAKRLLDVQTHQELFDVIQEIIGNLVGSEELALFRLDEASGQLHLMASSGIDESKFQTLPLSTLISEAALQGTCTTDVGGHDSLVTSANVTACFPLRAHGRLLGALVLFRLLPQKPALQAEDLDLLEYLAKYAAKSLACSCPAHQPVNRKAQ